MGAEDDAEPYRALVLEGERIAENRKRIAQAILTGGRKRRQVVDHVSKHLEIKRQYWGVDAVVDGAGAVLALKKDPQYDDAVFCERFRMSEFLFSSIHTDIQNPETGNEYFMGLKDAVGRVGPSSLQRMVSVVRQLAYGSGSDSETEYTGVEKDLGRHCLYGFCQFVVRFYGPTFLNKWDKTEMEKEMAVNAARGFPGMLGSIDCQHWRWKNCPVGLQGVYQDRNEVRSIVAEAIAGHDMYIYQAYVGLPGCLNDLNILSRTDTQKKYMRSYAIRHRFKLGATTYKGAYFLADGIYPKWAWFVKTIPLPVTRKQRFFAKKQEGVRKDVERAFGRLHSKWHILKNPGRCHKVKYLKIIWLCCISLHNMTIRDQQTAALEMAEDYVSEDEEAAEEAGEVEPVVYQGPPGLGPQEQMRDEAFFADNTYEGILAKRLQMENREVCRLMHLSLQEHV